MKEKSTTTTVNSRESAHAVIRFAVALQLLKEKRIIRGKKTFTDRYGINRWNMNTCLKSPESGAFQISWLTYLVRDYGVSPRWLLTGEGSCFAPDGYVSDVKNL